MMSVTPESPEVTPHMWEYWFKVCADHPNLHTCEGIAAEHTRLVAEAVNAALEKHTEQWVDVCLVERKQARIEALMGAHKACEAKHDARGFYGSAARRNADAFGRTV